MGGRYDEVSREREGVDIAEPPELVVTHGNSRRNVVVAGKLGEGKKKRGNRVVVCGRWCRSSK